MARTRPEIAIADGLVTVEPGQVAQTTVTVRNTGTELAEYKVSLVPGCVPAAWTEATPPTVRVFPGKDQRVVLRFRPPMDSSTAAGTFPYGVRVTPDEANHQASVVGEADVAVGAIHALDVKLRPRQSRGRWRGKHLVQIRNRGTEGIRVRLSAADEQEELSFALAPATIAAPPQATSEAFLRVRPRSPRVFGKPSNHPFDITYRRRTGSRPGGAGGLTSDGELEASVSGAFTQKPILSPGLIALLMLVVAGLVLLLTLAPWEKPEPIRPPNPPQNARLVVKDDNTVAVQWEGSPRFTTVEIREVTCESAADVFPLPLGEPQSVEATSGPQSQSIGPFDDDSEHCVQVRGLAGEVASIWSPSPAMKVAIGSNVPAAPVVSAKYVGECAIQVSWTPVVSDAGDAVYNVNVGGKPQQPVTNTSQVYEGQRPGDNVEVFATAVVDGVESERSAPVTVAIPDDCDEEGGGGDGSATVLDNFWLLVVPPQKELSKSLEVTWQSAAQRANLPPPVRGIVDGDDPATAVSLPAWLDLPFDPGYALLYVDIYENDETRARLQCAELNRVALDSGLDPTCRLVLPDGSTEAIAPATEPSTSESSTTTTL